MLKEKIEEKRENIFFIIAQHVMIQKYFEIMALLATVGMKVTPTLVQRLFS